MKELTAERFSSLQSNITSQRIAIVGDLMVDRYFWGSVNRISPEAPVPVVDIHEEAIRMGGGANCANNIARLGGTPVLIGLVGEDTMGRDFQSLLSSLQLPTEGIVTDSERPTTVKTRIISQGQQLVRTDREDRSTISAKTEDRILALFTEMALNMDAVILQDYNKGLMTPRLVAEVIRIARAAELIITVDPKMQNFFEYREVTLFKPNQREAETALGYSIEDDDAVERGLHELQGRLQCDHVLITRGERGMALLESDGTISMVPTLAQEVADVSGAGDTVISTLTTLLTAGAKPQEAASIANQAAGIVVGEVGVVPISIEQLAQQYGAV
jgi:D-glycero-beta-D-manno-heptose-7-phosphate kinase